jgi:serine/threonine-protein kinase
MALCGKCHREAPEGALFCSFCGASIRPETGAGEPPDPLIGQKVHGKYLVHELIGRGGMGEVYKATHLNLDRPVVLKLLKKSFLNDPSIVQRFHREARAASRLNHPNSVSIIDFGEMEDKTLFMVMEYLKGRSLARVIAEDQPLPEARVVHIGAQILAALAEAHALGIIHRDLKPENVMLESRRDEPDFVKVLDFGIAKLNEPGDGAGRLTQAGIVCGTPGYMSPEQVRGDELDPRSDIYSVGVILYEMLTGLLPFEADTPMGLVTKHLVEEVPPLGVRRPGLHVTPGLEELVLRCLAKGRDQRPASAEELRKALLDWLAHGERAPRPTPPPARTLVMETPAPSQPAIRGESRDVKPWRPPTGAAAGGTGPARTTGVPAPAPAPRTPAPRPAGKTPAPTAVVPTPPPRPSERMAARAGPEPQAGGTLAMTSPRPPSQPLGRAVPAPPARAPETPAPVAAAPSGRLPAPGRSKVPLAVGGGVAALAVAAAVVWFTTRPATESPVAAPPPPAAAAPVAAREPAAAPPVPLPPPPTGTNLVPAAAEPGPAPAAPKPAAPEPAAAAPSAEPPAAQAAEPGERVQRRPARRAAHPRGIRSVRDALNSIPIPPARSGEGVLSVIATPWAEVWVDGVKIGETPREMLLGAGTYRVRATHPSLGTREAEVVVTAGKRKVWNATFAN